MLWTSLLLWALCAPLVAQNRSALEAETDRQMAAKLDEQLAQEPGNLDLLLARAELALRSGDAATALLLLQRAEAISPAESLFPTARALLLVGATDQAVAKLERAIDLVPDNLDARLVLAIVQRDSGRLDEAMEIVRGAIAVAPDDPRAREQLALMLLSKGENEAALAAAEAAFAAGLDTALLRLAAGVAAGRLSPRREEGVAHLERALELEPPDAAKVHLELGSLLASLGRHREAEPHLVAASEGLPNLAEAQFRLATTKRALGDETNAALALQRFQELTEQRESAEDRAREAGIALNEAQQLAQNDRLEDAAQKAEQILREYPQHPATLLLLAKVRASQGELEAAAGHLATVRGIEPGKPEVHFLEGIVLRQLDRAAESATAFERALLLEPDLGEAHAVLAGIRLQQERPESAAAHFRRALELGVDGPQLRVGYSQALAALGRQEESALQLERAKALRQPVDG